MTSCKAQLLNVLKNSENLAFGLNYIDGNKNHYHRGSVGGLDISVIFTNVKEIVSPNVFLVEGVTALPSLNDTSGVCCIDMFLAEPIGDSLINIRPLGTSNSNQTNPGQRNGYFSLKIKVSPKDRLFFCGDKGSGLLEFYIGKLVNM